MAIYKIFPEKSATLYSYYPTLNAGIDEVMELSTYYSIDSTNEVSRPIIKFPTEQINDVIRNKVSSSTFDCYLKLSLAYATQLPLSYDVFVHPLAVDWNMGTGRLGNSPITTDGASWQFSTQLSGSGWFDTFISGTTGSYRTGGTAGGGVWYTGSNYASSQSFSFSSNKDIELKVTNIVAAWTGSVIPNYGFILKHSSSIEFTTASKFETKYFSGTTHTIYPPCLEIRWNDFRYITGSLSIIDSDLYTVNLGNNKPKYQQDSIQRFRINVRPKFPPRTFSVSSFNYSPTNYALPTSSYWSLIDLDTEEIVIDYDTTYTKISCDNYGNYFDLYMNGLEPERYYKLIFKTILTNNEAIIFDENYYFKVIR